MGGEEIQLQSFLTSGLFGSEWSFYAPAALRLGTAPPVPIKYEAGWGPGMETFPCFPVRGFKRVGMKQR
jgi:hypothetical protein